VRSQSEEGTLIVKVGEESFTLKPSLMKDGTWTVDGDSSHHTVKVLKRTGKNIVMEVDGETREIEWEHVRKDEAAKKTGTATKGGKRVAGGIYPPMPGKISEVRVKVGDKIQSGQTVCILEAMKMFNEMKAPSSGTVKEVNIKPGSLVALGDLLVLVE
jgi:biotin carboxyl carrier protein